MIAIAALLPIAALGAAPNPATELVRNGGFEASFSAQGIGASWADGSAWASVEVAFANETARPFAGDHAQKIECLDYRHGSVNFGQGGIPVERGQGYRVRLSVRGALDSLVEVQLRRNRPPYRLYLSRFIPVTGDWRTHEFAGVSTGTDSDALFGLRFYSTGTLWVDDVSITADDATTSVIDLTPPAVPVPEVFFGMHVHKPATRFPTVRFRSWRLWDSGVLWPHLEPAKGRWEFAALDNAVALAERKGIEIILPLGMTPKWASARPEEKSAYNKNPASGNETGWAAEPSDIENWRTYVRTVAGRYRGRVRFYEIWNEVNEERFFSGTIEQLVALQAEAYRIIKEIDPASQVVAPSVVGNPGFFERLHRHGAARWCDIVSYHYYNFEQPENFVPVLKNLRRLMDSAPLRSRPLWNTESGWYIESTQQKVDSAFGHNQESLVLLSSDQAPAYLARAHVLFWAMGTERTFFYAWDNARMGLAERDGTPKPAARAYAEIQSWLVGKRMVSCRRSQDGIWTAVLERPDKRHEAIVWSPDHDTRWQVPDEFADARMHRLDGASVPVTSSEIEVSFSPVLLSPDL